MSTPAACNLPPDRKVATTCPYCGVGCGVLASADGHVRGDPVHPANGGRLCVKGAALGETLGCDGRLLAPMRRREDGALVEMGWDQALNLIAQRFGQAVADHGPGSVALYVSGQLLTEDYYVANKLMKGFIGSANIDTNSRLCMASAVVGHQRAFGEDLVPGCYEDLEQADLVVLVGSNLAWCHPVLHQRLVAARMCRGTQVVVIDPRRTATCNDADLHLAIAPDADVLLFNGLLVHLADCGAVDETFVHEHTRGLDEALALARATAGDLAMVAGRCGVSIEALSDFYRLFAATKRTVTVFSQGVNQSIQGSDKVNAIINCHLLTGRIGQVGMGPFSVTGQPNAMGGREVGGMATALAAHLTLGDAAHGALVQGFWQAPRLASQPGLKAVDLFQAVGKGRIQALWIIATNPVVSLPEADAVRQALAGCPFVVLSDLTAQTDTAAVAQVLLPAQAWGEKDGTVTNSERCISRQRPLRQAPGQARPDWWALCQVARRLGFASAFDYPGPWAIFDEHARLAALAHRCAGRFLDLEGLAGLDQAAYDGLAPTYWPFAAGAASAGPRRLFADGRFAHNDGRAAFIAITPVDPAPGVDAAFPLLLNTGRLRDQWHTMTRTGLVPTLLQHQHEPTATMHPQDAAACGLGDGDLATVHSRFGTVVARLESKTAMRRGEVFVPIHWNEQFASDGRVGAVVAALADPLSGEPAFKRTPVAVKPLAVDWQGMLCTRHALPVQPQAMAAAGMVHVVRVPMAHAQRLELAGQGDAALFLAWVQATLGGEATCWGTYQDMGRGVYHAALVRHGRLEACLHIAPRALLPAASWLDGLFGQARLIRHDRLALLAGMPLAGSRQEAGPMVCSCFRVGRNTIIEAICDHGLSNAEEVTSFLRAGGNCGSCLPEIRELVATYGRAPIVVEQA